MRSCSTLLFSSTSSLSRIHLARTSTAGRMLWGAAVRSLSSTSSPSTPPPLPKEQAALLRKKLTLLGAPTKLPPSKPANAYATFVASKYKSTVSNSPDIPQSEKLRGAMAQISQQWKNLSFSEKENYISQSQSEKEKYQQEYQKYLSSLSPQDVYLEKIRYALKRKLGVKKATPPPTDVNAPKRPLGAYMRFCADVRKSQVNQQKFLGVTLASASATEGVKLLGNAWKNLPAEVKHTYEQQYEQAKLEYKASTEAYLSASNLKAFESAIKLKLKGAIGIKKNVKKVAKKKTAKKAVKKVSKKINN